jgi:nucleoside-diphosphate-sugar epimerase
MLGLLISMTPRVISYEVDPSLLRPSDVTLQIPDVSKFKLATGWEPEIPLETTLVDLLNYHRDRISKGIY